MNFEIGDVVKTKGGNLGIFAGLNAKGDAMIKIAYVRPGEGLRFIHNKGKVENLTLMENPSCVGCVYNRYISYYEASYGKYQPITDYSNIDMSKLGQGCPKVANEFRKRYAKFFTADGHFDEKLVQCPEKKD